jgi:hypothetical protein
VLEAEARRAADVVGRRGAPVREQEAAARRLAGRGSAGRRRGRLFVARRGRGRVEGGQ